MTTRIIGRLLALLAIALTLTACSATRYAYNQAPVLLYWWADDWFDFDRNQAPKVKETLVQLQQWHRANMLPAWQQQLQQLIDETAAPTTAERVCYWGDQIQQQFTLLGQQVIALSAPLVPTLGPRQWKRLEDRIKERNDEWQQEWMPPTQQAQLEHRYTKTLEQAEKWYGRMDKNQRQLIRSGLEQSVWSAQRQLDQVIKRQRDLQTTLRNLQNTSPAQAQQALQDLLARSQQAANDSDRQYNEQLRLEVCDTVARFHNSTNAEQRKFAQKRLQGYLEDIQALSAQQL